MCISLLREQQKVRPDDFRQYLETTSYRILKTARAKVILAYSVEFGDI